MARKKKIEFELRGGQLLARGDVIQVMDGNDPVTCQVLACLGTQDGGCLASLEIIDGERKGERIDTKLRPDGAKNNQPEPEQK